MDSLRAIEGKTFKKIIKRHLQWCELLSQIQGNQAPFWREKVTTVTHISSAQQRQKDREMLEDIDNALRTNDETRKRLEAMRREVINRLGLNKPDGGSAA
ncbi:hypothetical protein ACLKTN_001495 [Cronobacter sakazakii]